MKTWIFLLVGFSANLSFVVSAEQVGESIPTKVVFTQSVPNSGNLILGVFAGGELGAFGLELEDISDGGLSYAIKTTGFDGKKDSYQVITGSQGTGYSEILLAGLGDKDAQLQSLDWQNFGGSLIQKATQVFDDVPSVVPDVEDAEVVAHIAYGAKLGSYYFDKYFTDSERKKHLQKLTFITAETQAANNYFNTELDPVADAIWYARNISNEPANVIYPESFVNRWQSHFKGVDHVKIKVLDEKDMIKQNMGAIYGVGRGSKRPPRMMVVEYMNGDKAQAPVLLVGKGITFDTGGISLKNPPNMWNMKFDMSGAANVIGTIHALAGRKAKVNVVAIAALAENMPGGNAQRPGDIVTSMSGKTIQIRSTDAEGRLVLADGNHYGDITYNPQLMVNLATLTGSASRATGKDYAAMFTRHNELVPQFIAMGKSTGDEVWHLPLNDNHFKAIESDVADVMNSGPKAPGASAGAAFLGTFVRESTPWVHLDIAGVAYRDDTTPNKSGPGSTAFGIRLLNGYIKEYFEIQ